VTEGKGKGNGRGLPFIWLVHAFLDQRPLAPCPRPPITTNCASPWPAPPPPPPPPPTHTQVHYTTVVAPIVAASPQEHSTAAGALRALVGAVEGSVTMVLRKAVDAFITQVGAKGRGESVGVGGGEGEGGTTSACLAEEDGGGRAVRVKWG
jgi:hypothetical protein